MASRILGMGDVLTLIEKAEAAVEEDEQARDGEAAARRASSPSTTSSTSYKMLRRMGPLQGVLKMIPGVGKQLEGVDVDEKQTGARRGDRPLDDAARAPRCRT